MTKPSRPAGGDTQEAVKALIVGNDFLEAHGCQEQAAVATGYSRSRFDMPRDR